MNPVVAATLVVLGYLAGAIPWGVVIGRMHSGTDLRHHGSGATGTTNAYRILGWRVSVAVLILDFLKGFLPVLVTRLVGADDWIIGVVGVATVVGHCWSPLIRFRGGKGMATGAGAIIGMIPWMLAVFPVMLVVVYIWRYVSLSSLVGSILGAVLAVVAVLAGWNPWSIAIAVVTISTIIVVQHRENINRLRSGDERKLVRPTGRASAKRPPVSSA